MRWKILTTEIRKKYTNGLYAVEYFLNNIKDVREQEEQITFYQPNFKKVKTRRKNAYMSWIVGCLVVLV